MRGWGTVGIRANVWNVFSDFLDFCCFNCVSFLPCIFKRPFLIQKLTHQHTKESVPFFLFSVWTCTLKTLHKCITPNIENPKMATTKLSLVIYCQCFRNRQLFAPYFFIIKRARVPGSVSLLSVDWELAIMFSCWNNLFLIQADFLFLTACAQFLRPVSLVVKIWSLSHPSFHTVNIWSFSNSHFHPVKSLESLTPWFSSMKD